MRVKKIISTRKYRKHGYQNIKCLIDGSEFESEDFVTSHSFTFPNGEYIGDTKTAHRLCQKRGIKPQTIGGPYGNPILKDLPAHEFAAQLLLGEIKLPTDRRCSIGFCESENKWYGWSHRAIFGFTIGDVVTKGHAAFIPSNAGEFVEGIKDWYSDREIISCEEKKDTFGNLGVEIQYRIHCEDGTISVPFSSFNTYPNKWGRGEWTVTTMEEAKELAIDFARSVS